jgi:hypothetical protein
MYRFRLNSPCLGVVPMPDGKRTAVVLPAGREITTADPAIHDPVGNRLSLVQTHGSEQHLWMFLIDLLVRGERI